jgi:FdhD protein
MAQEQPYSMMTANLVRPVRVVHVSAGGTTRRADVAATEEPMEIRVDDEPFAVTMRTPGADHELAAGFLLAERVLRSASDIVAIERDPELRNIVKVRVSQACGRDFAARIAERRRVVVSSSCGLCGRVTIQSLRAEAAAITADWSIRADLVTTLPDRLRRAQAVFEETGGLHAAGLFDRSGALDVMAEDVGRHNAVDKVIGRGLLDGRVPLADSVLFVSGRTSYEIVQKAFVAGIPIVGAVSAPSSLAVELADEVGITLLGFVRGQTFNAYSNAHRILGSAPHTA